LEAATSFLERSPRVGFMSDVATGAPQGEVPESDWAEQHIDADPRAEVEGEPGQRPAELRRGSREVDEADLVEQETIAYIDDDEV
jgi:hypothetical protein